MTLQDTHTTALFEISAIAFDQDANEIYVATTISSASTVANYRVEKLSYHPQEVGWNNERVLVRSTPSSFISHGADTKWISDLAVGN